MAKMNITFNNVDYRIDETVFEPATSALESYLLNNITGEGASVKFGGQRYTVDSVKLSDATNRFISHVITISGSGPKVQIGGVDYSVDYADVTDAFNSIGELLDTLQPIRFTLVGSNGKSGYQLAKESGFVGTFDDYISEFDGTADAQKAAILKELLTLKHPLRVNEHGDFKILSFSDVQCDSDDISTPSLKETAENIEAIVARENPDFVLWIGDNSFGMDTATKLRNYLNIVAAPMESRQIPWAHVYGNHDDETVYTESGGIWYAAIDKEDQQTIYESFEYCVSKDVKYGYNGEELFGVSNFVLPVMSYDGTKVEFNIWGVDSGAYTDNPVENKAFPDGNYFLGKYEYIQQNQIDWYDATSKLLEEYNGGMIYGMMAFHIPLQESYTAWTQREEQGLEWEGEKRENISACSVNSGLFDAVKERGDIKLIANGHDHLNDFMVKYDDIRFCYNACIGTDQYHSDDLLGGRVINFNRAIQDDFDTHMTYVQERTATNPLVNMVIDEDNTVRNAAYINTIVNKSLPMTSYDYSVAKEVKTDDTILRKFVSFAGGDDKPSVYNVPASDITPAISDGFSYEVLFRANALSSAVNYVGILDLEEAGGFGLNLYRNDGDTNRPILKAEVAYDTTWSTLEYPIDFSTWYHCIYSFDGSGVYLYVNGRLVAQGTVNGSYRPPSFSNRAGEEYLCIGGCAAAWGNDVKSTGIRGLDGDIAICNLYPDSMNADRALELYKAARKDLTHNLLLDLSIDADKQVVTNGAHNGKAITESTSTNSSKVISTDPTIGKDIVTFVPGSLWTTTSAYVLHTSEIASQINDGFSAEVYFNIDNLSKTGSTAAGILNYEEGGGFGIDVKPGSGDTALLELEIAYLNASGSNTWLAKDIPVSMHKWEHCVLTYTGPNAGNFVYFYLNGEKVYSTTLPGNYNPPKAFYSIPPFLIVGACANGSRTAENGFGGSIATCRIYSNPLTDSAAKELYDNRNI